MQYSIKYWYFDRTLRAGRIWESATQLIYEYQYAINAIEKHVEKLKICIRIDIRSAGWNWSFRSSKFTPISRGINEPIMHLRCADTWSNFQRDDPSRGLNRRRHICTRHSARHKVERAAEWFVRGGARWPPFSGRGEFVLRAILIATWSSTITSRSMATGYTRVYEWETINCIHSMRSAPRATSWSYFDHYLSEIGMLCSRLHVSAPGYCYLIVAFDERSCILQGENQRFGSQNRVRGKSLG